MKKIYQIIILCAMATALVSCGGGFIKNVNSYSDYKEACEQHDFQKAYTFVNELKKEMQDYQNKNAGNIARALDGWTSKKVYLAKYENLEKNFTEAEHYVVLQEATYILESQGLDGLVKIAMIVKEHNAKWVYNDLIDIAVAMGNEEMANRMKELAGSTSGESTDEQ